MTTRYTAGGERTLVTFQDNADSFHVYIPRGGVPGNVAGVLAAVLPRRRHPYVAGELACDFISACSPSIRCHLAAHGDLTTAFMPKTDLRVLVYRGIGNYELWVKALRVANGREVLPALYDGRVGDFLKWAEGLTGLEDIVHKVVKFKYKGGSNPGAVRMVRVEEVDRADGAVHICGYDLAKPDLKRAFRRYSAEKIEGDIQLVG